MKRTARLLPLVALAACTTPAMMMPVDAGPPDTGASDAGPITPMWTSGPDYPTPIAFGTAMILPASDGFSYLYVIGGASGTFSNLAPFHAEIRRAQLQADNSLGPWQDAGHINTGHADFQLAGHGAIRIYMDGTNANGMAIAGGGGPTGLLGQVLAGYVQTTDGSVSGWGSFAPQIMSPQMGHLFGNFVPFEPHQLALVGGMEGNNPSAHVIVAATAAGTMVPTWADGPMLPAPRYGQGFAAVGASSPDIYLIGGTGNGATGPLGDVLVTVRDMAGSVTGWANAGLLNDSVVFPQVAVVGTHVYVIGGTPGDPIIDDPGARVRMATATHAAAGNTLSTFTDVMGGALPAGRSAGLTASIGPWVYIVGGVMGVDHTASTSVIYARMEQ